MGITVLCLLQEAWSVAPSDALNPTQSDTRKSANQAGFSNCFCLVGTQVKTQASMSYAESISTPGGYPKHCRVNFLKMQVGRMGVDGVVRGRLLQGHVGS